MKYTKTSPHSNVVLANAQCDAGEVSFLSSALAFEVVTLAKGEDVVAPEWIQVFPEGPTLSTNDGRQFKMSDPVAFVENVRASQGFPILVDYDHLSHFAPDENGNQEAAGWIEELEVRDGQVWARVAWTIRAAAKIVGREYRFISPEFHAHSKTGEVMSLDAAALVNRPAFSMAALAHSKTTKGDTPMLKEIAKALGLPEDADLAAVLAALQKKDDDHQAELASAATPSVSHYMPRADYDAVLARAEAAEAELGEAATAARQSEVDSMIAAAVSEGKITPATRAHYVTLAMASSEGFEEIKKLTEGLSPVVAPSDLDTPGQLASGLTDEDKQMAASLNISEDDYAKELASTQK